MLNTILGQKKQMSQTFVEDIRVVVTLVKAGPCIVTQIKKEEKNGYWAVQLGFGEKKIKNITKPLQGHLKAAKTAARFLREVRLDSEPKFKVGDSITVSDVFSPGDLVSVTGTSKGKGFAGVVKRWGFAGGPRTHGQSDRLRAPGSIGQGTTPGRVHKGKKMPGRMGGDTVTIKNMRVVSVDVDKDEIALSGPVPGPRDNLLIITKIASGVLSDLAAEGPKAQIVEGKPEEPSESPSDIQAGKGGEEK
ncbi:50S ribosomal protein L3 [Patescibacteria group bacterium]|nr:50S ribosomal protein L3 [Patescibacteria group bacterium]